MIPKDQKPLVLIVEDYPNQAQAIAKIIELSNKYDHVIARDGIDALAVFEQNKTLFGFGDNRIKAILLDLQMPNMDGLAFLKTIRKQESKFSIARYVPVIFLSAHEDEQKWRAAQDPVLGRVSAYLKKPFIKEQLIDLLDAIVFNQETETLIEKSRIKGYDKIIEIHTIDHANSVYKAFGAKHLIKPKPPEFDQEKDNLIKE